MKRNSQNIQTCRWTTSIHANKVVHYIFLICNATWREKRVAEMILASSSYQIDEMVY